LYSSNSAAHSSSLIGGSSFVGCHRTCRRHRNRHGVLAVRRRSRSADRMCACASCDSGPRLRHDLSDNREPLQCDRNHHTRGTYEYDHHTKRTNKYDHHKNRPMKTRRQVQLETRSHVNITALQHKHKLSGTIESPEPVRRVIPPSATISHTMPQLKKSHRATACKAHTVKATTITDEACQYACGCAANAGAVRNYSASVSSDRPGGFKT
jgi:hypothetical protein